MFNRFLVSAAALCLLSAAPVFANGAHADKGASRNGLPADAFFTSTSQTVDGVPITEYTNFGTVIDVFQVPSSFTSGTSYTMTFSSVALSGGLPVYGIFDCDNGSAGAIDANLNPLPGGSACTKENEGAGDAFVNFNQVGNSVTVSFLGGAGAPSSFYFWTTPSNLISLTAATTTGGGGTVPEPGTFALLGAGLIGLAMLRRRAEQL